MGRSRHARGHRSATRHVRRPTLTGTVRLTDAGGFVETAEGTFKLTNRALREVMNGDTVAISIQHRREGGTRALVESVIERATQTVVGTFEEAGPLGCIRPLDTRLRADFFVLPRDDSPTRAGVSPGDVVSARIVAYPTRHESGVVTVERRLGDRDAPDLGIRCIMARYDLQEEYPEAALREAEALALDVEAALEDPLRRDLRDRLAFTIDPIDARDFDDAISIRRTREGGYALGVHIADVSHYVLWDTSIDLEARRRGTSVYLADRVLPMLPERLSNDLCSLRPNEDRLTMTVDMVLDATGACTEWTIYPSVIRSRARLTYDAVDAYLAGAAAAADAAAVAGVATDASAGADAPADVEGEAADAHGAAATAGAGVGTVAECSAQLAAEGFDLPDALACAAELAQKRRALRARRGAVDFDTVEVHALIDEAGEPYELVSRVRTDATGLVEEAMLLANECVARWMAQRHLSCAYRVHEVPTPDHLQAAASTLKELGIVDHDESARIAAGDQTAMQGLLARVRGTSAAELANALLLRAMQRAVYRSHNEGHYALGADAYCHFTSPIRRYPDLLVHRTLKYELARRRLGTTRARARAQTLVGTGSTALEPLLPQLCRTCSERERAADAAAHASQKVEVARYYAARIGERARGTVTWVDTMGAFVRLDGTQAEGLVHTRDLGDEWFDLDERTLTFVGTTSGKTIRPGDRVIVEVSAVHPVRGHLDLVLIATPVRQVAGGARPRGGGLTA